LTQGHGKADMDLRFDLKPVVHPVAIQFRHLAQRLGHRLEQQDRRQDALADGPFQILRLQPLQGTAHIDLQLQVIMRDLPVGTAHGRGYRLPHSGMYPATRRLDGDRSCRLLGCALRFLRRLLDIATLDDPMRTGALNGDQVHPEFRRQPAGRRRSCSSFRFILRLRRCNRDLRRWLLRGRLFHRACRRRRSSRVHHRCALTMNQGQHRAHRHLLSGLDQRLAHDPVLEDLHLKQPFLGLNHGDDVSPFDRRSRCNQPFDQTAGLHIRAQAGHAKFTHGSSSSSLWQRCCRPAAGRPPPCGGHRVWAPRRCRGAPPADRGHKTPFP